MINNHAKSMEKALDEKKNAGAILTDLSNAFDCLNHDLLIAKFRAYGFDHKLNMGFLMDQYCVPCYSYS